MRRNRTKRPQAGLTPDGRSKLLLVIACLACVVTFNACRKQTKTSNDPIQAENSTLDGPIVDAAQEPKTLRVLGTVPAFELTDQDGESFNLEDTEGQFLIATFIFTRCGATCPLQTAEMARLQSELRQTNDLGRVRLVSFTVDPGFDTPEVLRQYGVKTNADFSHWKFLTGDRSELWDLSNEGFKLEAKSGRDSTELISHSQNLILVDRDHQIRGYYAALAPVATERLREDLETLLDEAYPNRDQEILELSEPVDVRDPQWLEQRASDQIKMHEAIDVRVDFRFEDQLQRSGITFKDNVVEDVKRLFKAAHYDHGTGVAVADVDGDSLLDIYFVCQLGSNQLWRNLGDGTFEDITDRAGVAVEDEVSVAASFADVDNDRDADLYVTRVRAPNQLFLNDGTGRFENVSQQSGLDHVGHSSASTFFDYDRDGRLDLLLSNVGKYTTEERGPGGYYLAYPAAFAGHLYPDRNEESILFHNEGDGRFVNANDQLGFHDLSWSGDATPIDANEDGWLDLYLLNMQGHDEYYENQQGKSFVKKSRELFPKTAWGTMGSKVFDYNRDGKLDLYLTDMHTDMVHLLEVDEEKSKMRRNLPINMLATDGEHILGNAFFEKTDNDKFVEVSDRINAENYWPWGISVADLNADGFEDVFISASMSFPYRYAINSVLLNGGGRQFVDSEFALGVEPRVKGTAQPWMQLDCDGVDRENDLCFERGGRWQVWAAVGTRSSVIFDLDDDGDLDIVTNDFGGTPMVLVSNLQEQQDVHYLKLKLVGEDSNRDALGAVCHVEVGEQTMTTAHDGKSGYLSQSRMPLYFGLGPAEQVDRIVVDWPSGKQQILEGPIPSNQTLQIDESDTLTNNP